MDGPAVAQQLFTLSVVYSFKELLDLIRGCYSRYAIFHKVPLRWVIQVLKGNLCRLEEKCLCSYEVDLARHDDRQQL